VTVDAEQPGTAGWRAGRCARMRARADQQRAGNGELAQAAPTGAQENPAACRVAALCAILRPRRDLARCGPGGVGHMEKTVENLLYASRWLLAPIYIGLSLGLIALGIKFFQEMFHILPAVLSMKEADLILVILSLVDIALVGGLLVMVMFSGYENFVSRIDIKDGAEKLHWLGKLDAGSLKQKVAASIVAISSIHLLKAFMNAPQIDNDKLMWYVIIHMTFVVSALGMALVDRMNQH
jgi:uncharacterized protein (TIGR00645 family)